MTRPETLALERGLPAAVDAEQFVLGSLLLNGDRLYPTVAAELGPADFAIEKHRRIFARICDLAARNEAIEPLTVVHELEKHAQLESCDGFTYIVSLSDGMPRFASIDSYIKIVKDKSILRNLVLTCDASIKQALDIAAEPAEVIAHTEKCLMRLGARTTSRDGERRFDALSDGRFVLRIPGIATEIEVDRLRRERQELFGELAVRCRLPGAKTFDGSLSIADFNLSSARARQERAKLLASRSEALDVDWTGLLEEFVQRVLSAERNGQPAVDLRTLEEPERDEIQVEGFTFPRRHPSMIFGDGGAAKSYTALWLAGRLAQSGMAVALFDWELAGEDHRYRLRLLFGAEMPRILYARCERPLATEAERLRRIVREEGIDYAIFDSVAFACDGPPEAAEVAGRYFRATREIGIGSLHIAHVNKSLDHDKRPFGSAFWHNGARCTWFVKAGETSGDESNLRLGFFNRKANLGPIRSPLGLTITFSDDRTHFRRSNVADTPDLAGKMSVRQRMLSVLRHGAMPAQEVAEAVEADPDTVRRTARRYKNQFIVIEGGKLALCQRDT